ncbi:hypothetical protein M9Y10_026501 [Tritrichomonas musculus]|uniref:Uncharacterized protein n=1 Tax=Tritrichomonas musculus TaxID=1915356 RepID=A0ABR2H9L8_9EUKA
MIHFNVHQPQSDIPFLVDKLVNITIETPIDDNFLQQMLYSYLDIFNHLNHEPIWTASFNNQKEFELVLSKCFEKIKREYHSLLNDYNQVEEIIKFTQNEGYINVYQNHVIFQHKKDIELLFNDDMKTFYISQKERLSPASFFIKGTVSKFEAMIKNQKLELAKFIEIIYKYDFTEEILITKIARIPEFEENDNDQFIENSQSYADRQSLDDIARA